MKANECLIIPIEDMRKLMDYLVPQLGIETYKTMSERGVLKIFNQIQDDIRDEDGD